MATSAGIGMTMPDGTVKANYVHWDGYPAGAGAILAGWYNTPEMVEKLLALGDLSTLGRILDPDPAKPHRGSSPQPDVTLAYHRDCGEDFCPPFVYKSKEEYGEKGKGDLWADYLYLFEDGKWFVKGLCHTTGWLELTVEVCQRD